MNLRKLPRARRVLTVTLFKTSDGETFKKHRPAMKHQREINNAIYLKRFLMKNSHALMTKEELLSLFENPTGKMVPCNRIYPQCPPKR